MADKIGIYNMVRTRLRETGVIVSTTQDAKIVELLNTNWDATIDAILREDVWTFAKRRVLLSSTGATPAWGLKYEYLRMPDDMRLLTPFVDGSTSERRIKFELAGRFIYTDVASPLRVRYITNTAPVPEFDPLFVELLTVDLATKCAGALTGKTSHVEMLISIRPGILDRASRVNSIEQEEEYADPDDLFLSRSLPV